MSCGAGNAFLTSEIIDGYIAKEGVEKLSHILNFKIIWRTYAEKTNSDM
jgi:hypothetical protein